jgi:glycosyltransferase involved in cell wall biosynthesis
LAADDPQLDNRLLVNFVGHAEQRICKLIQQLGLNRIVHMRGNLPHGEAIRYMQKSHVLLLFELPVLHNSCPTLVIPSKIFEYIGARRTIMAMVNSGDCAYIIERYKVGEVVDPLNIDSMAAAIHSYLSRLEKGLLPAANNLPQEFCRDFQACRLSRMIREIC